MTVVIHTFKPIIPDFGSTTIEMPEGAKIVQIQPWVNGTDADHTALKVWAEVDPEAPLVTNQFVMIPTGSEIPADGEHQLSFQAGTGFWHVYRALAVAETFELSDGSLTDSLIEQQVASGDIPTDGTL